MNRRSLQIKTWIVVFAASAAGIFGANGLDQWQTGRSHGTQPSEMAADAVDGPSLDRLRVAGAQDTDQIRQTP
jgi:hypothetical protein